MYESLVVGIIICLINKVVRKFSIGSISCLVTEYLFEYQHLTSMQMLYLWACVAQLITVKAHWVYITFFSVEPPNLISYVFCSPNRILQLCGLTLKLYRVSKYIEIFGNM